MNSFLIIFISLVLIVAGISMFNNLILKVKTLIFSVKRAYSNFINGQGKFTKLLLILMILGSIIQMFIVCYIKIALLFKQEFNIKVIFYTIILFIFVFICVFFLFGIPLLIFQSIGKYIESIENGKNSLCYTISFCIIIFDSFFLYISKIQMIHYSFIVFIGLVISYLLNIKILISGIINPLGFILAYKESLTPKSSEDKKVDLVNIWIGAIFLIILIIINLFLCVLMVSNTFKGSYYCTISGSSNNISVFDLFYYTVITFTTIGYGDIVPNLLPSKIIAVAIAFTSVLCLIIFASSILSIKDKFITSGNKD